MQPSTSTYIAFLLKSLDLSGPWSLLSVTYCVNIPWGCKWVQVALVDMAAVCAQN